MFASGKIVVMGLGHGVLMPGVLSVRDPLVRCAGSGFDGCNRQVVTGLGDDVRGFCQLCSRAAVQSNKFVVNLLPVLAGV
jgi:hypothetical protein